MESIMELFGGWDIDFALAAIPVQVLFLVYYMRKRKLPLKDTMYFTNLMYFNLAAMIAGILSAAACAGWKTTPVPVIYGLNVGYHLFILLAAYNGFRYVMETLHAGDRINPKWMRLAAVPVLPMALVILVSQFFGSMISVDPETGIHQGSLYPLFYGFLIFYLVLCLATALAFRTEDNEGQVEGILTAGAFIMAGILLEGYYWQELFLSFSFTMGIAVIYLTVRNPDLFLDHKTELMTREAFRMIMRQLLKKNDFEGFGFVIRDYDECRMAYGGAFVDGFLGYFGKYLRQEFSKQYLFYMGSGRFFIISTLPMDMKAEVSKVHERFRKPWGRDGKIAYFDINCCLLDDTLVFSSVDELKQCIGIAFETADSPKHEDVIIDKGYQERVKRQFHVRGLLEESLAGNSLEVFLQPLVEASSGRVEGAEALVRMKDKDGSIVGPAEFIDMASATGAVSILGEQVFAKVCEFIRDGGLEACGMKWVHVNVAPVQCLRRRLAERLNDIRESYGVPVSTVRLELTEQGALNSAGFKQVGLLKNMGFDLVLDDYGTGFSNASRMKGIPFEEIKIDMSLVRGHFAHPDSYLPNLIQSMHRMGFKVVAEGVETKEMVDGLKRMGCDYFQGFYYSKPVSMQDFLKKYSLKEEKREVFTPSERAYEETERYGSVFAATLSDNSR